jgi:hypothetical protein
MVVQEGQCRRRGPRGMSWLTALGLTAAGPAQAHVKWFVRFDAAQAPLPLAQVLTGHFAVLFLLSLLVVHLCLAGDRHLARNAGNARPGPGHGIVRHADRIAMLVMRTAAGVFFIALALIGLLGGGAFLLTPELKTPWPLVPWLQLAMGLCALSAPALPLIGVGIVALYVCAVYVYGLFHMSDYVIFLGLAYFFIAQGSARVAARVPPYAALYVGALLTLLWASIEKFAYPGWSYALLCGSPGMLMGLSPERYMPLAGFVEFNIAFMLLCASSRLFRVMASGLLAVFALAIVEFGWIDAVGHLVFIAILAVMAVRGPGRASGPAVPAAPSRPWGGPYAVTGLYALALLLTFIAYYGGHRLYYGR